MGQPSRTAVSPCRHHAFKVSRHSRVARLLSELSDDHAERSPLMRDSGIGQLCLAPRHRVIGRERQEPPRADGESSIARPTPHRGLLGRTLFSLWVLRSLRGVAC
jgi:hypothetical protein